MNTVPTGFWGVPPSGPAMPVIDTPHGAWAAYLAIGRTDSVLRGIENVDTDRQAERIMSAITAATSAQWSDDAHRVLRATVYSWLAFTLEFCRQRILDPSLDADMVADVCARTLLDAIIRTPGLPADSAMRRSG